MVAIPKITKRFETSLASALSAAGTSFTLESANDEEGNALSGLYGITIDVGNSNVEDGVVTISGNTATFSLRGCDSDDPLTEVSANKKAHRRGAPVVITDYPILAYLRNILNGESGYTIPNLLKYASGVVPISVDDLVDKGYVDALLAGVVTTVNVVVPGTAGETVAAGNLIYFDDADNEWKKCDADTAATVENTLLAIAQGAGVDGGAISGGVLLRGLDANQSGLTAGAVYYASNTAGGISSSAGTKEVTVGFSYSTTQLYFNPRFNQQITEDEQDALAATSTPSSSNKFITQKDLQIGAEVYAASSAGSDAYAITLSPVLAAYVNGMMVSFKADVANTGAATLNLNSLGAVDLTKHHDQALETGDIEANQIVTVIYNSSTAKFQMVSQTASAPGTTYTNGVTTKNAADASTTQTIAHGLGKVPKKVRIRAIGSVNANLAYAETVYNGTTQSSISGYLPGASMTTIGSFILNVANAAGTQTGVVTFDATNITITWTKTDNPTGTYQLLWEAEA